MEDEMLLAYWWLGPLLVGAGVFGSFLVAQAAVREERALGGKFLRVVGQPPPKPGPEQAAMQGEMINARLVVLVVLLMALMVALWGLGEGRAMALVAGIMALGFPGLVGLALEALVQNRAACTPGGVRGQATIEYWVSARSMAARAFGLTLVYGVVTVFTASWFVGGGAAICGVLTLKFWRQSSQLRAKALRRGPVTVPPPPPPPPA